MDSSVIRTTLAKTCAVAAVGLTVVSLCRFCFSKSTSSSSRRRRILVVVDEWQNLPADILILIAERSEIRQLRAVCSSWRSSLPLPDKSPLLSVSIPQPLFVQDPLSLPICVRDDCSLTLSERNIYCLEPLVNDTDYPESWIVKLESSSGKMFFSDTLSYTPRPVNLPVVVNLFGCRVLLVGKEYYLGDSSIYGKCEVYGKVVLSDDAMLCILDDRNLGYFKFGDGRWTIIVDEGRDGRWTRYTDIIYHKHKFYVIYNTGRIIVVDSSLNIEVFISPDYVEGNWGIWYFVQSSVDLFVLKKYNDFIARQLPLFKVYRLNSDEKELIQVANLGDQTFFIGQSCTFSISAEQISGCSINSIYFDHIAFAPEENGTCTGELRCDVIVFNLNDNSSRPLNAIRRYSRPFWPIPFWLMPRSFLIGALG